MAAYVCFQFDKDFPGGGQLMVAAGTVRKDQTLLGHVDEMDKVRVDDKSAAQADEVAAFVAELVGKHVFHLPELERDHLATVILRDDVGVIAVRRHIHQPTDRNAEHLSALGYDQESFHLCKDTFF